MAQTVQRGRPDPCFLANVLQLVQQMGQPISVLVGENPLPASSMLALLKQNLI
jgi:hypothetical protein